MCGSGTLAIEAALIAAGIPPGIFRKHYGFENWKDFDRELMEHVVREAATRERSQCSHIGQGCGSIGCGTYPATGKQLDLGEAGQSGIRRILQILREEEGAPSS